MHKVGVLFLIVVEWMMRKQLAAERMASGAKFTTKLNDLDVTDDIPLPSSTKKRNQKIVIL